MTIKYFYNHECKRKQAMNFFSDTIPVIHILITLADTFKYIIKDWKQSNIINFTVLTLP